MQARSRVNRSDLVYARTVKWFTGGVRRGRRSSASVRTSLTPEASNAGSPIGQSMLALPAGSDVNLFSNFQGVIDLDAEIPHRALDLRVAEEQLNGA